MLKNIADFLLIMSFFAIQIIYLSIFAWATLLALNTLLLYIPNQSLYINFLLIALYYLYFKKLHAIFNVHDDV